MEQLLAHLVGDYILQSHWMATEKRKDSMVAWFHAFFYSIPFIFLTQDVRALWIIWLSHAFIDHFGLARYVVYAKNYISPRGTNPPWSECSATGYPSDVPPWLSVWLLIIADNTLHLVINYFTIKYLG